MGARRPDKTGKVLFVQSSARRRPSLRRILENHVDLNVLDNHQAAFAERFRENGFVEIPPYPALKKRQTTTREKQTVAAFIAALG